MRAIIKATSENEVLVEYDNPITGERESFEVFVPHSGGYVRFSNTGNQVCDGLGTTGDTLSYTGDSKGFIELIRTEYRSMMRDLKRQGF